MKDVVMFMTNWCPHCRRALGIIEDLREENPAYNDVEITLIDEDKDRKYADQFDYYRVPTFYIGGKKFHEGIVNPDVIRRVFQAAME